MTPPYAMARFLAESRRSSQPRIGPGWDIARMLGRKMKYVNRNAASLVDVMSE